LEQTESMYDDNGQMILMTLRRRFHEETGTGPLGTPSSGVLARVSFVGMYYDGADRPTATVNVGTNGGSAWGAPRVCRPAAPPC
jgi:hypothetical protein